MYISKNAYIKNANAVKNGILITLPKIYIRFIYEYHHPSYSKFWKLFVKFLSFCFIASFAFVLQRLRAKPIPLKMDERTHRLPPGGSCHRR